LKNYIDSIVIVGVLISILLGILSSVLIPNNAQFGFIIGLFGTIITLLVDIVAKLSKSMALQDYSDKKLLRLFRDLLFLQEHDSIIFDKIVEKVLKQLSLNLSNISQGFLKVGDDYLTINDLFQCGADAIRLAQKEVLAVEAGSNYDKWINKPNFQRYHKLTIEAVKLRKVKFERIWIIDRDPKDYHDLWQQHHRDGIKTYFIHENELPERLKRSKYLDFAIIDGEVLILSRIHVNSDLSKRYEGGEISITREDLDRAGQQFESLRYYTREFPG
jgi:hypothetical protein